MQGQEKNLKNIKKGRLLSLITYEFFKNLVYWSFTLIKRLFRGQTHRALRPKHRSQNEDKEKYFKDNSCFVRISLPEFGGITLSHLDSGNARCHNCHYIGLN